MAVVRWDPWGDVAALQRDMSELFGQAFGNVTRSRANLVPPIDAHRDENGLVVRLELPGIKPEDVDVQIADGTLTVTGERQLDRQIGDDQWVRRERSYGRFERTFSLPDGTNPDQISAEFEHGVLELRIPHAPERQPRRIEVKPAGAVSSGAGGGQPAIDVN